MGTLEVETATLEAAVVATLEEETADIPEAVTEVDIPEGAMAGTLEAAEVVTLEEAEVVTLAVAEVVTLEVAEAGMAATLEVGTATPEAAVATQEAEVVRATLATVVTNINREESSPRAAVFDRVSPAIETRKSRHPPPSNSSRICFRINDDRTKRGRIEGGFRADQRPSNPPPSRPPAVQQAPRKSAKVKSLNSLNAGEDRPLPLPPFRKTISIPCIDDAA